MTSVDSDELRALRQRAYGPRADIHLDPVALRRLRELENRESTLESLPADAGAYADAALVIPIVEEPRLPEQKIIAQKVGLHRRWSRFRRSTVLIALGLAVTVFVVSSALVVVQRMQTNPLQPRAEQVARLSADPTYRIPGVVSGGGVDPSNDVRGYQEFHGMRSVVSAKGSISGSPTGACLVIYPSRDITGILPSGVAVLFFSGCAAGDFPAAVQFTLDITRLPPEMKAAFPKKSALQFVFDRVDNEVVVYAE